MSLSRTAYFANGFAVGGMKMPERDRLGKLIVAEQERRKIEAIPVVKQLRRRNAELKNENERLRLVLVQISSWGCNGQCVELVGAQCPCCIAKAALKED